jgi:hypothetical protein
MRLRYVSFCWARLRHHANVIVIVTEATYPSAKPETREMRRPETSLTNAETKSLTWPSSWVWRLRTICGLNDPLRSRGTSSSMPADLGQQPLAGVPVAATATGRQVSVSVSGPRIWHARRSTLLPRCWSWLIPGW